MVGQVPWGAIATAAAGVLNTGASVGGSIYAARQQREAAKDAAKAQIATAGIVSQTQIALAGETRKALLSLAPLAIGAVVILTLGLVVRGR